MIAVIGLGFVGLTTSLGLAYKLDCCVNGYDIDQNRRELLKRNEIPFFEPLLTDYLMDYNNKKFFVCDSLKDTVSKADAIFFCVGTPCMDDGATNLNMLLNAVEETLKYIDKNRFVTLIIKSTVPPSTTKVVIKPLIESLGFVVGTDIGLATNPEFLREGCAWNDFISPDRIVIGTDNIRSREVLEEIFMHFESRIFTVTFSTAEFIKYLSNTFLATMISFSNEMSMIADLIGDIEIAKAFNIFHLDKRWCGKPASMAAYAYPGCGFGGYCLPKDTAALHNMALKNGYDARILKSALDVNDEIMTASVRKITKLAQFSSTIGIMGLSFKSGSNDVRNTPSITIINRLIDSGYRNIISYDPLAMDEFEKSYRPGITYANTLEELINRCDLLVLLTTWQEFKDKQFLLKEKKVLDLRYYLNI